MALIKCVECGKEISSRASACPFCGCPFEAQKVKVHIFRPRRLIGGTAITGHVFIDGKAVGSADNGVNYTVEVSAGHHQLSVESNVDMTTGSNRTSSVDFDAIDKTIEIELGLKVDAAGLLFSGTGKVVPKLL